MDPAGSRRLKKIMYPQNALHKKGFVSIGCALVQEPSLR
jgi:hypothetical protein